MSNEQTTRAEKIEFRCACGTRFRVAARLSGRRGRCTTCGSSLVIPATSTQDPVAAQPKAAQDLTENGRAADTREMVAVEALCSICQSPIEEGDDVLKCSVCHLPFHPECWQENLGCSTYGCSQVNILKKGPDLKIDGMPTAGPVDTSYDQPAWHCAIGTQFYGPVSVKELAMWVRENRITAGTMVWKAGMVNWQPIASMPELVAVVDPAYAARSLNAGFPWELVLLAASAIAFLISLASYGIPSLLLLLGIGLFGMLRLRASGLLPGQSVASYGRPEPIHWKYIALLVLAAAVSLAGFVTGLVVGID